EDTTVYVKFPIVSGDLAGKASIAVWTTTPWTLPANLAIAVHPKELYVMQEFANVGGASVPRPDREAVGTQRSLPHLEILVLRSEDTTVYVKFPIVSGDLAGKASIAVWTTTPWTLPANLAIAVHPKELYVMQEFANVGGASVPRPDREAVGTQRSLPHLEILVL